MAIHFITSDPRSLLHAFEARISQRELEGKITTWGKSDDGKYFTHKATDWNKRAWFMPTIMGICWRLF